ncbi:two-component system sensor histidine kinase TctE [Rhodobacter aestuarii]|uniref:histidine kinase n=1 Tax=Rhodobacter aestuarii TaxID=453582 RepID=A0A1N7MRB5_9RHOB|nr:two-component system sensor histidine kinase TctE [Rhodobacter aestuarii]SIS88667.1 two-component system, OmpR family, sensor histidine kinase TctE [Rhodobacter aestuarii]
MREAGAASSRPLSLTARLVVGLSALLLIGGLILSLAAFAYGRAAARDAFDRLLVGAANDIAASISIVDGVPVVDLPLSAFELLGLAQEDRIAYQVLGPQDTVLTGYDLLPLPPEGQGDVAFYDASFTGDPARYIRVTRRFAERQFSGAVQVIVGQTTHARTELALDITRNALAGLVVGGVAIMTFAVFVVRQALRPLNQLAASLALRDPRDLTPIDAAVPPEVDAMVQAINGFMGRLNGQFRTMKNLISDTAHQLRTPVAALRAQADLAAGEEDAGAQKAIVTRLHSGTVRLSRLLDQMLSRALVIHRGGAARREPIDLRDIALDVFDDADPRHVAPEAEVHLEIGEAPVMVLADGLSLTEAAKNLLGNALAHGTAPITIGADQSLLGARLWVRDVGAGPSPALLAQLGERFATGAAGRVRGSGLGLSIAQAVAEAFDGELQAESGPEGFCIAIVLPPEPEP